MFKLLLLLTLVAAPISALAVDTSSPLSEAELLGMLARDGYTVGVTRHERHVLVIEVSRGGDVFIVNADLRTGGISIRNDEG